MEALRPRKQLALDTNLLLDLAADVDFAHDFKEVFQRRGYAFLAPPTVLAELHEQSVNSATMPKRELARIALAKIVGWDVIPLHLSTLETAIAERLANRFLELRLLPDFEYNDAMILAETAVENIPLLVTSDKHLLDLDEDALALAFTEADLPAAHPVRPKALLRAMRQRSEIRLALGAFPCEKEQAVERWQSGLTRTPGERECLNSTGGSNPPLSAIPAQA